TSPGSTSTRIAGKMSEFDSGELCLVCPSVSIVQKQSKETHDSQIPQNATRGVRSDHQSVRSASQEFPHSAISWHSARRGLRQYFFCCCGLLRVKQGLVAGRRPLNQLDRKPVVIDLSCQVVFKGRN